MAKLFAPADVHGSTAAPRGWMILGLAIAAWMALVALIFVARSLFGFVLAAV